MKRIVTVLAVLSASALPAFAGGDWDDDDYGYYYEHRYARGDYYRPYDRGPAYRAPAYEVYIPYGYYFADEPYGYGPGCEIERKWKRGRYREKIECDDDD